MWVIIIYGLNWELLFLCGMVQSSQGAPCKVGTDISRAIASLTICHRWTERFTEVTIASPIKWQVKLTSTEQILDCQSVEVKSDELTPPTPIYEEIKDIDLTVGASNKEQAFDMHECGAYTVA